ncbi:hypothetical protein JDV02_009963 [Purpureocillium takamizusanense]|uniref:Nuclear pore protein n=1 Tax=Purpureocillium takamizusanense TaxID=2060973 RepID=A0A9Q8VGX7_9HYPO|nr:uncharacterized protein JDV02_009963 [Purpureocillium takamizusanense]UNI24197.1 hypothetical protein JDV02_009963 [Purpureocillium takamizusanense]
MLYGTFAEAKDNQDAPDDWTISLGDDNPDAMKIFLDIAHDHFSAIPKALAVGDLYDLVVLTHYYDSTRLLTPWVEMWMSSLGSEQQTPPSDMPKLLWISWEFGRKEDLTAISQQMLLEFDGTWFNDAGNLEEIQTPPYIIERMVSIRSTTIRNLLDIFHDMVETLTVVDEKPRWCRHATWMGHHRCESMILGSMTFCLTRAELWPLPDPSDVRYSVAGLYKKLASLIIHDIGDIKGTPSEDHRQCNPREHLLYQVQQVMERIPDLLTDYHKNRLEEQSRGLEAGAGG